MFQTYYWQLPSCCKEAFPRVPVCYMSRTLFHITFLYCYISYILEHSMYQQQNCQTSIPEKHIFFVKGLPKIEATGDDVFTSNVISHKDSWTFRIFACYSSGQTAPIAHCFGALIAAFPTISDFPKLCDSQWNKQSQSFQEHTLQEATAALIFKGSACLFFLPLLMSEC